METKHKRGRIGLIALAVGLLALGLVLGSGFSNRHNGMMDRQYAQSGMMGWQQAQPNQGQPQAPAGPRMRDQQGMQGGMMQDGMMQGGMMQDHHAVRMGGMHRSGPGGLFGGLFGALFGLVKLAFWGFAIYLIYIVWRDRKRANGSNQASARPGPEDPPYTGNTTSL